MAEFLPANALVISKSGSPDRMMLFLHGIFGSGANWRSFARRVVDAPAWAGWGAVLVDLRMHGASQAAPPPHTVASAAADLVRLGATLPCPVGAVVGHSFGGKVALEYVKQRAGDLDFAFVLDANPGPRPTRRGSEIIVTVLEALEAGGPMWSSREAFVTAMMAAGITRDLGQWLAMNLRPDGAEYRLRMDLVAVRELLADYWERDLWSVLEGPPGRVKTHVVLGGKSRVFADEDKARLARAARDTDGRVVAHVLAEAGHWVHVDDPDGLFALFER